MATTTTLLQEEPINHSLEFRPDKYPALPEDLNAIELETILLSKLEDEDENEADRLFDICKNQGFFYLDITGTQAEHLKQSSEKVARLAENIFRLPLEEKRKYIPQQDKGNTLFGYKWAGRTVTDKNGTRDTAEFFNIAKNEVITDNMRLSWPEIVLQEKKLLAEYVTTAHRTGLFLLSILAKKMNLAPDALANLHRLHEQSGDHIRLTRGPPRKTADMPEIQTPGHTDFGTITLLFNWLGGLQIWSESNRGRGGFSNVVDPDGDAEWLWVKPVPGKIIVNLGDAAVKFTNGLLCSGRHRVIPAPGEQGKLPRYSVVYFVRPEDKAILKTLKSPGIIEEPQSEEEEIEAGKWILKQAIGLESAKA